MLPWIVLVILMLNVFITSAFKVSNDGYCYKDKDCSPYMWGINFLSCRPQQGKLHSPIDLSDERSEKSNSIQTLKFLGFADRQTSWSVANVRDSVAVGFKEGMTMSGGWLKHQYRLLEMRFHWGSNATNGSEHTLNKRRFPMELQMVAVAPGFTDVERASLEQSGLAMMGVFIDIGPEENAPFKTISDAVAKVPYPGDSVNVSPPELLSFIPGKSTNIYYYQGGQTTPPCRQTVEWIVFVNPILISKDQYLQFTTHLFYSNKSEPEPKLLVENYRPIQSSTTHKVYASTVQIHSERGSGRSQHTPSVTFIFLGSLLLFSIEMA